MSNIGRIAQDYPVVWESSTVSKPINISMFSFGSLQKPADLTGTTITYEVTNELDANGNPTNWSNVKGTDNAETDTGAVTVATATNQVFPIFPEVFFHRFVRFKSNATETGTGLLMAKG